MDLSIIEISYKQLLFEQYAKYFKEILEYTGEISNKENFLFSSRNGLGLGGVEAWTVDICKALIQKETENVGIISNNKIYVIPDSIKSHVHKISFDDREMRFLDVLEELIRLIISKLPCKIITSYHDEIFVAACIVKYVYSDGIKIISVIHEGIEKTYSANIREKEFVDLYIGVSQDIRDAMIERGIEPDKVLSMTCPFECDQLLNRTYTEDMQSPIK